MNTDRTSEWRNQNQLDFKVHLEKTVEMRSSNLNS